MPTVFEVSIAWDDEASVWVGSCDDVPAAADASTIDELMQKLTAMTLDLLPDNHPSIEPADVRLQLVP